MTKHNNSIIILYVFFGRFPWYISYFLHTCKFNPTIQFRIITDNNVDFNLPENVKIVSKTMDEIVETASKKLGFGVKIFEPYKFCDFKPAYGFIFEEIISGYDFWGHGDIDVIFGNIRAFLTDILLNNYDVICLRHDFLTGYFTLFRNNVFINQLFKKSKDYKKVFKNTKHYCFDETNYKWDDFTDGVPYNKIKSEIESMTHVVRKLQHQKLIRAHFDFLVIEGNPGKLKWENGSLYYKSKYEILLYHLIRLKGFYNPKFIRLTTNKFYISSQRIYH